MKQAVNTMVEFLVLTKVFAHYDAYPPLRTPA